MVIVHESVSQALDSSEKNSLAMFGRHITPLEARTKDLCFLRFLADGGLHPNNKPEAEKIGRAVIEAAVRWTEQGNATFVSLAAIILTKIKQTELPRIMDREPTTAERRVVVDDIYDACKRG